MDPESIQEIQEIPDWWWQLPESFEDWFQTLTKFVEYFGHSKVPQHYKTEDGKKLGHWVSNQRVAYKQNQLAPERVRALESLPGWAWVALVRRNK